MCYNKWKRERERGTESAFRSPDRIEDDWELSPAAPGLFFFFFFFVIVSLRQKLLLFRLYIIARVAAVFCLLF